MEGKRPHSDESEQSRKRANIEKSDSEHSEQSGGESGEQSSPSQQYSEYSGSPSDGQQPSPPQQSSGSQSVASQYDSEQSSNRSTPSNPYSGSPSSVSQQSGSSSSAHLTSSSSSSSSGSSNASSESSGSVLDNSDTDFLANRNYRIIREIGSGSYGYVYQAQNTQTNQIVAIKVLKVGTLNATVTIIEGTDKTFERLLQIQHTNIVANYSCDRHFARFVHRMYIVSEFTELPDLGESLQITNNSGNQIWWPLDEYQSRHMIRGIASGVHHMHSNGMSHSDLKLDNVLLFWSNNATQQQRNTSMSDILTRNKYLIYELIPKLTDFDRCGLRSDDDPEGKIMVTAPRSQVNYAAPETYKGVRYDLNKADCYSVGCCLMAMLLASHPFDEPFGTEFPEDVTDPNYAVKKEEYKKHCNHMKMGMSYIRQLIHHLSPQLRQVLEKLLDPNSDSRITIDQFLADQWFSTPTEEPNKPERYTNFGRTYPKDF